MTIFTQVRDALVADVNSAFTLQFPTEAITFDNQPFDYNNPPEVYTKVDVEFHDGRQASLGADPKTRYLGHLYATVYAKHGAGTRRSMVLLDWFAAHLKYRAFGPIQLGAPAPDTSVMAPRGWEGYGVKVSFTADDTQS